MAFLLLSIELDRGDETKQELEDIESVIDIYEIYGVYDLIVRVVAESKEKLNEVINYQIRELDSIRSILTLIVTD